MGDKSIEYPGWRELPLDAKTRIRLHLKSVAAEKDANDRLEAAYKRVMYDTLVSSVSLFAEFATEEEREQQVALIRLADETPDDDRHIIDEQIHILERTVALRRDIATCEEHQDNEGAVAATASYELWLRQMRALRLALDTCGLHRAHFTVAHGAAHISLKSPNASAFDAEQKGLNRVISALLGSKGKPRISFSTWYPVFLPPEEED